MKIVDRQIAYQTDDDDDDDIATYWSKIANFLYPTCL